MSRCKRLHPMAMLALLAFLLPRPASAVSADDTALFSAVVPPNVMLLVDNSGSMASVVWHPAYDPSPSSDPTCHYFRNYLGSSGVLFVYSSAWSSSLGSSSVKPGTYSISSSGCVTTAREIYVDPLLDAQGTPTRWDAKYLDWYFSSAATPYVSAITSTNNGTYSSCVGGGTYSLYRRSRVTSDQDTLRDVICQVNAAGAVRFGIAEFRTGGDPNGGYVWVPSNDYLDSSGNPNVYTLNGVSESHGAHLNDAIDKLKADAWTPLAESLFQVYTYFMSRNTADIPVGADGTTKFPKYVYETDPSTNGAYSTSGPPTVPDSPVQYECQKNFVIILTDGEPTMDDFSVQSPSSTAQGFSNFMNLIGNYDPNTLTSAFTCPSYMPTSWKCHPYLADVAKYMHDNDFRPDMPAFNGVQQTIDVYTIGFTTSPWANMLLQETANVGGGKFYYSNDPNSLAQAIIGSISDIIQKSQSFTAATVPATRTSSGGYFYTSLFVPSRASGYWQGHLKSWQIDAAGNILDANGNCALNDPNAPTYCQTGSFLSTAVPFWDAGQVLQSIAPSARKLYASRIVSAGTAQRINFDTATITSADMNITAADIPNYNTSPYTAPTTAAQLTAMVVDNLRGCALGSTGASCAQRSWKLGDIFHSNPVVVPGPSSYINDPDYTQFEQTYQTRKRVIIAGANDGFLRFFDAGTWQAASTPPAYDAGTGKELAGFMPYSVRQDAKQIPIDANGRTVYGVDGSPTVADVWLYSNPLQNAPHDGTGASRWRTVVVGGERQGGRSYYALDVTNPAATSCPSPETGSGYPCYMWEFPREDATGGLVPYMGQTWSEPVITKVRVNPSFTGAPTATTPYYDRWVAIFGTGFDPKSDPNDGSYDPLATEGRALVMVDLATGKVLAEKKFDPSATTASTNPSTFTYDPAHPEQSMHYAIASTPSVLDLDNDGYADVVYVGDLGGNLWKWVIHDIGQDPINGTGSVSQPYWPFQKVFSAPTYTDTTASPAKTYYKSIFYGPSATIKSGKLWLAFGTGERANLSFKGLSSTPDENNRLYAFVDRDPENKQGTEPVLQESDLADLTSSATCANLGTKPGYFFRAADGEKFITPTDIVFYEVLAASYTPQTSADPCVAGGVSKLYAFKVYCGEGAFINPSTGTPSVSVNVGSGLPTAPQVTISPGLTGTATSPVPDRVIINSQAGQVLSPGANCPGPQCACPNWPTECPPLGGSNPVSQFYWRELQ